MQHGVVEWGQLRLRGVSASAISRAVASGRIHAVHDGVYSVVAPAHMTTDAWHAAAVLAGGPGACLCSHTAGWWADVVEDQPGRIHVAVNSALKEIDGVRWHRLRLADEDRIVLRRMPITALARIPLDLAAEVSPRSLKRVLAELEFHHGIGPEAVAETLRRGYPGSAKLRRALAEHMPELALTRGHLERAFAHFLADRGFTLPEFNHPVGRSTVDALYADQRIVIELDGVAGHSGERRVSRDHRRDAHRRAEGLTPLRYHCSQLRATADQLMIEAELDRLGVPRNRVIGVPLAAKRVGMGP